MSIQPQIPDPAGVKDERAVSILRTIKSVIDAITGRAPNKPQIKSLAADANTYGIINKINEIISQLQFGDTVQPLTPASTAAWAAASAASPVVHGPVSAVDGDYAVFDGGPAKIRDGGPVRTQVVVQMEDRDDEPQMVGFPKESNPTFDTITAITSVTTPTIQLQSAGSAPTQNARAARGTLAAPSALQTGDLICTDNYSGYGSAAYSTPRAHVDVKAAENWTDAAQGTTWSVSVTQVGGTAAKSEALKVNDNGTVNAQFGATAATVRPTSPNGYFSYDTSSGINASITSTGLVGKTIVVKDGIITAFS